MTTLIRRLLMSLGTWLLCRADDAEAAAYQYWPGHPDAAEDGIVIVSPVHEWAAHHLFRLGMTLWELGWYGSQDEAEFIAQEQCYDDSDRLPLGHYQLTIPVQ